MTLRWVLLVWALLSVPASLLVVGVIRSGRPERGPVVAGTDLGRRPAGASRASRPLAGALRS